MLHTLKPAQRKTSGSHLYRTDETCLLKINDKSCQIANQLEELVLQINKSKAISKWNQHFQSQSWSYFDSNSVQFTMYNDQQCFSGSICNTLIKPMALHSVYWDKLWHAMILQKKVFPAIMKHSSTMIKLKISKKYIHSNLRAVLGWKKKLEFFLVWPTSLNEKEDIYSHL